MKTTKITYWIATAIIALMMTYSAYAYLTQDALRQAFHHLGFPDYFRVELAFVKLIGVVVLLAPVPARIKDLAYAGFLFTFISAFIAHTASGDPVSYRMNPLIFLAVLVVSYLTYRKQQKTVDPEPVPQRNASWYNTPFRPADVICRRLV